MNGQQKQGAEKPESIRQWYQRTTSKARMSLIWVSAVSIIFGVLFFLYAPLKLAQFMQTANGAVTIPIAGGIWIAAFVYIFLVPSREVGFRSQESIEQTVEILNNAVENKIKPALETWLRIGSRVEAELNGGLMNQIKESIKELRDAAAKITNSAENSNGEIKKFADDARPAIDALKRVQEKFDSTMNTGFLDDLQAAVASMKHLSLPAPDVNVPVKEPKLDKALSVISKRPSPKPVIPPPPLNTAAPVETPAPSPVPVQTSTPVVVPAPSGLSNPAVAPPGMPVMVPTSIGQNQAPMATQPVTGTPSMTPTPGNRFTPAPPPSPVVQGSNQASAAVGSQVPVQIVLPPSSSQRQAPEIQAPAPMRSSRPGEVEIPMTQKSRPVVVTPITQQTGGVVPTGTPLQMVGAPQVIQRSEG